MSQGTGVDVDRLSVATSPHIREGESVSRIMWTVNLTLLPVGIGSLFIFGWYAGAVILVSVVSCAFFEALWQRLSGKPITVADGSAVITGMLLAFVLPPNVPLFVAVVASAFGILIAKQIFGGLGYNIWNPALAGRAFVQLAYPVFVTPSEWPIVSGSGFSRIFQDVRNVTPSGANPQGFDAVSMATPLSTHALANFAPDANGLLHVLYPNLKALFLGNVPGCIGETSALLIIIGGLFLIYKGYVNWKVPAVYLGMLFLLAFLVPSWKITGARAFSGLPDYAVGLDSPGRFFFPMYQVLAGGVVLGAFFMATDMVTAPITSRGQVIFALGCGVITWAIRLYGHGFPEGCCYAILLMNTTTPIIDRYTRPTKYGAVRK
jgi:electron transport complex protein RnfD